MPKSKLARFTTEELQAELARRSEAPAKLRGADWYFAFDDENDEDYARVWVVHKRFWHMNHHIDDRDISRYVDMPKGFHECQESCFDCDLTEAKARKALVADGFTEIDISFCTSNMHGGQINQCFDIKGVGPYRVTFRADTAAIKQAIEDEMKDMPEFARPNPRNMASLGLYKTWMRDIAERLNCHVEWYDEYDGGCYGFMMDKNIFKNLPPEPVDEEDD